MTIEESQINKETTAIKSSTTEDDLFGEIDTGELSTEPVLVRLVNGSQQPGYDDRTGQQTYSFMVDDAGKLPAKSQTGKASRKNIVFPIKTWARAYVNNGFKHNGDIYFFLPPIQPSKNNAYWVRSLAPFVMEFARDCKNNEAQLNKLLEAFNQ